MTPDTPMKEETMTEPQELAPVVNEYDPRHPHERADGIPALIADDGHCVLCRREVRLQAEARADALREAADRVRAVPAVPIRNTDYVPRFKRRADQCVDRFAVLRAVLDQPPVQVPDEPEPKRGAGDGQGLIA